MRKILQFIGVVMLVEGISGTIDQIVGQPFYGVVLNLFNRVIVEKLDVLNGYEIYANLILAVLGIVTIIIADQTVRRDHRSLPGDG